MRGFTEKTRGSWGTKEVKRCRLRPRSVPTVTEEGHVSEGGPIQEDISRVSHTKSRFMRTNRVALKIKIREDILVSTRQGLSLGALL